MTFLSLQLIAQVSEDADLSRGVAIAVVGLVIVFTALLLISIFIASLPRILELFSHVWPEVDDVHARQAHPETRLPDDAAVLAAIGFVLHTELQKQLANDKSQTDKK